MRVVAGGRIASALPQASNKPDRWRWLDGLLVVSAGVYIVLFVGVAVVRVAYPYPLDPTEPAALSQVERIVHGQPLYGPPTLEYVPLVYGPLSFYLAALLALVMGPVFATLRVVSLLASLGTLYLLFLLVRRETHSVRSGLLAAGLFAAANPVTGSAMDIGRVDALFTFFILAAAACVRFATARPGRASMRLIAVGGLLVALAAFTKVPMAAAPIGLALALYLAFADRRAALIFVFCALTVSALVLGILRVQFGPWATWYLWDLPRQHFPGRDLLGRFWINDLLPRFTAPLIVGPLFLLAAVVRGDRGPVRFYGPLVISLLGVAWASRANGGGAANVLLPACAGMALLFGLGLNAALSLFGNDPSAARVFRPYWLAYNPRTVLPIRSDRWADERLDAALAAVPGPMFAPAFAGYPSVAARGEQPLMSAVGELWGGYGGARVAEGDQWDNALADALKQRRFRSVVLAQDDVLTGTVRDAGYVDRGQLIPDNDDFYIWRTPRTPQPRLFVAPGG